MKPLTKLILLVIGLYVISFIIVVVFDLNTVATFEDDYAKKNYPCIEHVKDWCYDIFEENNEFGVDTKEYNKCKQDMVSTFCYDECIIRYGKSYCGEPK